MKNTIEACLSGVSIVGKTGCKLIQPKLADALTDAGYTVDLEDSRKLLRNNIPVWRSKISGEVVPTLRRRKVDLVVYMDNSLAALIEVESDLNDLQLAGAKKKQGRYNVSSIAKNRSGGYFNSYNSLERMATAAYCWHLFTINQKYPDPADVVTALLSLASDDPAVHNPSAVPLFLVSGTCRAEHHRILQPRLDSLNATLVCGVPA